MKKTLVLVLAVVMVLSVVAFAACAKEETVKGEYGYKALKYEPGESGAYVPTGLDDNNSYGCKVTVTVKNGVITKVVVDSDTEHYYNLTSTWGDKKKWEDGAKAMIDSFVGLTVEEVNAITVDKVATTDLAKHAPAGQPSKINGAPAALKVVTGATQSSGRLILAVQNALAKLGK